jgi:hypothetical protein
MPKNADNDRSIYCAGPAIFLDREIVPNQRSEHRLR